MSYYIPSCCLNENCEIVEHKINSTAELDQLVSRFKYVLLREYIGEDLHTKVYFRRITTFWVYVQVNNGVIALDVLYNKRSEHGIQCLLKSVAEYTALLD